MRSEDKKRKHISGVPDFQKDNGTWVKTYVETTKDSYITYHTRGSVVWSGLVDRCKLNGKTQTKYPTYSGSENHFGTYQLFVDWAIQEHGYYNKDTSGKYWNLDKDLLVRGNKVYSPETCIFVPHRVNCLLTTRLAGRGSLPLGVYFEGKVGRFRANCQINTGKPKFLGYYDSPEEAHKAWQLAKAERIRGVSLDTSLGNRLQAALISASGRIIEDYENDRITSSI